MSDYSRFYVTQSRGRFSLLDQQTGWVWSGIRQYSSVLTMMRFVLDHNLQLHDEQYKRIRRLEGAEWEEELG